MQIHKNIIFKMKKHSISHSSNQNNSTEITFLKPKFFSQSLKTFSLEIIFFFYRRLSPCKKICISPYLFS